MMRERYLCFDRVATWRAFFGIVPICCGSIAMPFVHMLQRACRRGHCPVAGVFRGVPP